MNYKIILLFFTIFFCSYSFAQTAVTDSSANAKEDKTIEEVIEAGPKKVDKKKVEYLSEVTKYGFKNLFRNYTYNSSIPYDQQINPYAENYMQDYLKSNTSYLLNLKKTATPYFNLIDGILTQYGLPHELKYLAVIESNLKSYALSSAGARGPWQFMDYTARDYGLAVNSQTDDRTDYIKSTNAAAKYLLTLYKDMKDWLLVIAAYNGGPGRVYSAIKKSGSRDFWKLQYYLPEESRNHVKKFIATHFIMEEGNENFGKLYGKDNNQLINIPDSVKNNLSAVMISGRYKAAVIAKVIDMDPDLFNVLNGQLENVLAMGDEFKLQLPADKMALFQQHKYEILKQSVQQLFSEAIGDSKTVSLKNK